MLDLHTPTRSSRPTVSPTAPILPTQQEPAPRAPERVAPADLPRHDHLPAPRALLLDRLRSTGAFAFRRGWDIQLHDADLVPTEGPVILAANHLGVLDGPLLVAMTPRTTFALAKRDLFKGGVGRLLESIGQIPVDQSAPDPTALRRAVQVLDHGYALGIFPEGSRDTGEVTKIQGGVAWLGLVTGAPTIPVAILGTREPGQTVKDLPRRGGPIHIVYGESIAFPRVPWPRRRDEIAWATEQVRLRLADHVARAQTRTGLALPGIPSGHRPILAA